LSFLETVERARAFLERHRRVSLRALRREFGLDTETLAELCDELVQVQQVAAAEGDVLVWKAGGPLATPSSASALPERDPRAYTPKHLAEKILTSRSALEGERKQVTILFADVKGSMDLAEQVDPEEWHKIMDRFFAILSEGVHRFEGTVNQFTGDGIMALFGAPIAHEDHTQRACYAALHLQQELRRYADEIRLEHGLGFSVRMGINSGEVVVGKIGDDLRMDYTAQGHTVGLAARMEQMADTGKVLLTGYTSKLVSGYFALRDLGQTRIKGLNDPLNVFELEGLGRVRTRLDVSRARGFTKFVGREGEMAALEAALEQAIAGNAQFVGVVGEPGTGKSRLCYQFVERCRAREIPVYEAHGVAHGKAVPLLPILEFWRSYFGITEHDTTQAARDKIAGRMVLLDATLAEGLPLMFDFLGVPDPKQPSAPLGPEARQQRFLDLTRRLARARSNREPAVFLFEDLHWFDRASDDYIGNVVVEVAPGNRSLLLLNFRPEYHAQWMQRSHYHQLPLLPLGTEAIGELFADLLGTDTSLQGLRDLIRHRSGGNPFFIEETVLSLAETGALVGTRGAYRLATPTEEIGVPVSVQSVLAARIDRLPEMEKQVLQTASVIGQTFPETILRRVVDFGDGGLPAALHALTNAEFLYREALYPEAEYTFKHPLTQEVAYRSQLSERRARVHGAVARALEELGFGKLDERAAVLAHHWEHAGDAREAAKWHRRAAEWVGGNNPPEALSHWQSNRQLLETLPETSQNLAERAAACGQIMIHLGRMGDPEDQATALFREGRELAARGEDSHVLAEVLTGFGFLRATAGGIDEALDPLLESVRQADNTDDVGLRVAVRYGLGQVYLAAAKLSECLRVAEQGLNLSQSALQLGADRLGFTPSLGFSFTKGSVLSLIGHLREASAELDLANERARESHDLAPLLASHFCHVLRCELTGEAASALAHARQALEHAESMGSYLARIMAYRSLGIANVLNREWQGALNVLEQVLTIGRKRRLLFHHGGILAAMAVAHLGLGDHEKALALAKEAMEVSRRRGARIWEFPALLTRTRALRETHGLRARQDIEATFTEAAAWLEMSGAKSYEPFLHVERAELAKLTGDQSTRERELLEAHRLFTEIGAPIRAAEVAKELGLETAS
jgi:class 3 adenylate cyclase/tetratricopeptide (TPR) repeat protein